MRRLRCAQAAIRQRAVLVGVAFLLAPARLAGEGLPLVSATELGVRGAAGQIGGAAAALAAQAIIHAELPSTRKRHDPEPANHSEYSVWTELTIRS
jgi:hypothetical protein